MFRMLFPAVGKDAGLDNLLDDQGRLTDGLHKYIQCRDREMHTYAK